MLAGRGLAGGGKVSFLGLVDVRVSTYEFKGDSGHPWHGGRPANVVTKKGENGLPKRSCVTGLDTPPLSTNYVLDPVQGLGTCL